MQTLGEGVRGRVRETQRQPVLGNTFLKTIYFVKAVLRQKMCFDEGKRGHLERRQLTRTETVRPSYARADAGFMGPGPARAPGNKERAWLRARVP